MLQETGTVLGPNQNSEQIIGEQISVQGSFTTGKIKHQLFTDLSKTHFLQSYSFAFSPTTYGSGNILILLTLTKVQNS
jgi:iron complex outermembrane receptor protein